jgi:glucose-1-phosphate adenylyltransferase
VRHLVRGWSHFKKELGEGVEILPASQRNSNDWYLGTADAIWQNIDIIRAERPTYLLILSGDHIYKMDYGALLAEHYESGADMTVCCLEVAKEEAKNRFGVLEVDANGRVVAFEEKPENPATIPGRSDQVLASMGNYIFNTEFLFEALERDARNEASGHDFGRDLIPQLIAIGHVQGIPFCTNIKGQSEYWRDVGTLDSYWQSNMEMLETTPALDLYDPNWPLWTYQEQLPPAKFVFDDDNRRGMAVDSLVSGGCILSGSKVRRSILFSSVRLNSYSLVENSVLLPEAVVGRSVKLNKCIVDSGCEIPEGMEIGYDHEKDRARGFRVTEGGVVLLTRAMLGQTENYYKTYARTYN